MLSARKKIIKDTHSSCLESFSGERCSSLFGDLSGDWLIDLLFFSMLFPRLIDLDLLRSRSRPRERLRERDLDLLLDLDLDLEGERDLGERERDDDLDLDFDLERERGERDLDLERERGERDLDLERLLLRLECDRDLVLRLRLWDLSSINLILRPFNSVSLSFSIAFFISVYVANSTTPSFRCVL